MYNVMLLGCKRTDPIYQTFRNRHYIPNKGSIGQQLHYIIYLNCEPVGIISGGSAVYATKPRDDFFGITKSNRCVALNGIINNTVFRLEQHLPNLGTQVLAIWRKKVVADWIAKYHVAPCGFETFIIENERRKGAMYKADNWTFVGRTYGNTKMHLHGINNEFCRKENTPKLIFCKRIVGGQLPTEYYSSWKVEKPIPKVQNTREQLWLF